MVIIDVTIARKWGLSHTETHFYSAKLKADTRHVVSNKDSTQGDKQ